MPSDPVAPVVLRVREWDDLIRVSLGSWACEVRVNIQPGSEGSCHADLQRSDAWERMRRSVMRHLRGTAERIDGPAPSSEDPTP